MSKSIIVVSSYVDSTIREYQVDVDFHLFKTLDELDSYIENSPLRADEIFLTKEVFPNVNTSLNYFTQMLENPFMRVEHVTYITEIASPEIASINYIVEQKGYTNWEVIEGVLNREYVANIVNGVMRNEVINPKRKAVYRVPRETYLKERLRKNESLDEEYIDDERNLANIPNMTAPEEPISDYAPTCEIYKVVGDNSDERTMFAFITAQYLSFSGKTLILERDIAYHRLTEFVTKADLKNTMFVEAKELINSPAATIEHIRQSTSSLIIVGAIERIEYRYSFILNILYNNLMSDIKYLVQELDFAEAPTTERYTAVFTSTVIGVLKMIEQIDVTTIHNAHFVGICMNTLPAITITSSKAAATIIEDVLELQNIDVQLISINSLKIGGDSLYDLHSIIGSAE